MPQSVFSWVPVSSSNLLMVRYSPPLARLDVMFKSNSIYYYYDVPPDVYHSLLAAGSKGVYHYHNIRDKYEYTKAS